MDKKDDYKIEVLISQEKLNKRIDEISLQIQRDFLDKDPLIIAILKGSIIFSSDLIRRLNPLYKIDFIIAKSYVGTQSTGDVKIIADVKSDIVDKDILLVDDIADTGITIDFLRKEFIKRGAKSVKVCVLLDKEGRRKVETTVEYSCFKIPNEFVVGYGLDYNDLYRGLPYIGVLSQEKQ
ncbi:MAG: hypoxanthine phosphoribosyltransferase [Elusimicrobiota bacterium]|jgi:hypoxanthine phosphoribosyltransferase|nr:hypoxanthine phosphoribosyltransferase [Elusimicrobiota bacterium]